MKKSIFAFAAILSILWVSTADAAYILKGFSVRNQGKAAFDTSANLSVSGSILEFQVSVVVDGAEPSRDHRASFTLPSGYTYLSNTIDSADCTVSTGSIVSQNNHFSFDFIPTWAPCEAIVTARYASVSALSGSVTNVNTTLSDSNGDGFQNGNDIVTSTNSVKLTVSPLKELLRAGTLDTNGDGFLDAMDLLFSGPVIASPNVSDFSVSTASATWTLQSATFTMGNPQIRLRLLDGLFTTADLPKVDIAPSSAAFIPGEYFGWVVVDSAAPSVSVSPSGGTFTGAVSVSLSSSESGNVYYSLTGVATSASTLYSVPFSISTNSNLSIFAIDLWRNTSLATKSYAFQCPTSAPMNGTMAPYPSCTITCNFGYTLSGNSCVRTSGGGGGGGGGGWSSGGGGGWIVVPPVTNPTSSGSTSTGSVSTWTTAPTDSGSTTTPDRYYPIDSLFVGTLDRWYFYDLTSAKSYLETKITDKVLKKQLVSSYNSLNFADRSYYVSFDSDLALKHRRAVNAYVLYYLRSQDKKNGWRWVVLQKEIVAASAVMRSGYTLARWVEARYVSKVATTNRIGTIYRSLNANTARKLSKNERALMLKLGRLYSKKTLTKQQYLNALALYNQYVLHLTIYDKFGYHEAKKRSDDAYVKFILITNAK